jgi:hypothetical protein
MLTMASWGKVGVGVSEGVGVDVEVGVREGVDVEVGVAAGVGVAQPYRPVTAMAMATRPTQRRTGQPRGRIRLPVIISRFRCLRTHHLKPEDRLARRIEDADAVASAATACGATIDPPASQSSRARLRAL